MSGIPTQMRESSSSIATNPQNDRANPKTVTGSKSGIFRATFAKNFAQNERSQKSEPPVHYLTLYDGLFMFKKTIDTGSDTILANKVVSHSTRSQTPSYKPQTDDHVVIIAK